MRFIYPRSFLRLLLIGFALAAIPVLIAILIAAFRINHFASASQQSLIEATQSTRASYIVVEQIRLMERSFRQYLILHDQNLLKPYQIAHKRFQQALQKLQSFPFDQDFKQSIRQLANQESNIFAQLHNASPINAELNPSLFQSLSDQGEHLLLLNDARIDNASAALIREAEMTQRLLFWFAAGVLPMTLFIALIIAYILSRPIRRMDAAIRELGRGEYQSEIKIDGPGDLRILGKRLDWLRLQLDQLEHQKQQFLRHVSHELKTPLTAIREGAALLTDEVGGSLTPQQQRITTIVKDNTEKLQEMIESLLQYTAAQHQDFKLKSSVVSLQQLTDSILSDYQLSISTKQLNLQKTYASHSLNCIGDTERIRTVVDNLISNAVKYTNENGNIQLSLYAEGLFLVFDIKNSGAGIHPSDQDHIFEPFYRGINTKSEPISGSGLGLSIAKEYVEAHGGELTLVPNNEATQFQLKLPIGEMDV